MTPRYCGSCEQMVVPKAAAPTGCGMDVVHMVLTLATCGLWLLVWIPSALGRSATDAVALMKPACPICGMPTEAEKPDT